MALQTPRQRGLQRPSLGIANTASSPTLRQSTTDVNRKPSVPASSGRGPATPMGKMDSNELDVGDQVNVPGDMYGTVKFLGSVKGKNGRFVGVELDREFSARGKNDGDVDGIHYFHTSVPGAGVFLPIHRADRRNSPAVSLDSFPPTPNTPSYSTNVGRTRSGENAYTPPTPALPSKFSQSVGPGMRASSPTFKPKRPSLPRPESPMRRAPTLQPTPARQLSHTQRGARPTLTPAKSSFSKSTTTRPTPSQTPRPYSRTGSRLGNRNGRITEEEDNTPVGTAKTSNGRAVSTASAQSFSQPLRSPSRSGSAGGQEAEIQRLKQQLSERDKRLDEQAISLAEMEASVKEISGLLPTEGGGASPGHDDEDDQSAVQLRQMLREKNEKISLLTAEFDNHRADFRSTLDSLEMASTETERVYEEQKRDLLAQLAEMQDLSQSKEDFEGVAAQLKQLEELVAELEEGLEESRRGEAEARGEVEFLRGEVERGRSELKREREKSAAALKNNASFPLPGEVEQRDDEIRGLKAIIHSLSSTPNAEAKSAVNGYITHDDEVTRLQAALQDRDREKEALEREVEQLRRDSAVTNRHGVGVEREHKRNESEMTATLSQEKGLPLRSRSGTIKATFARHTRNPGFEELMPAEADEKSGKVNGAVHDGDGEALYCELCESTEHDTLECTNMRKTQAHDEGTRDEPTRLGKHSVGNENESKVQEEEKWCALCEKDGHLAFDCPEEQY